MKAPKVKKRSPAQAAAAQKFAAAGRAAQARSRASYSLTHHGAKKPRSKAQTQASLKWGAAGRASQAAKKQGKAPLKKAALVLPGAARGSWLLGGNDELPSCAATAVACHLLAVTGQEMTDSEILALHGLAGDDDGAVIPEILEALRAAGRLASFWQADEEHVVPGLVVVTQLPGGLHAVLSHPCGMVSWGGVLPWAGQPCEAWAIEWGCDG